MIPKFEYDIAKSLNTFARRGYDFEFAKGVWRDAYMRRLPAKTKDNQVRWAYTGTIGKKVYMVVVQELSSDLFRIIAVYEAEGAFLRDYIQHRGELQ